MSDEYSWFTMLNSLVSVAFGSFLALSIEFCRKHRYKLTLHQKQILFLLGEGAQATGMMNETSKVTAISLHGHCDAKNLDISLPEVYDLIRKCLLQNWEENSYMKYALTIEGRELASKLSKEKIFPSY